MDVLSEVVTSMRTGRPHSTRTFRRGEWGVRFDAFTGAAFHIVLQGSCWLIPSDGNPVALGVGDVVCLPHGGGHGLASDAAMPLVDAEVSSLPDLRPEDDRDATTVLLCAAYFLDQDRPHPLLTELPEYLHLSTAIGRHPALRAAVELLGGEVQQPGQGSDAAVRALLDMLLLYTLRAWYAECSRAGEQIGWAAALADPAISKVLGRIHAEPGHPWTVAAFAEVANLSRATLSRRFGTLVGLPPLAYLTWWRMTRAAHRLKSSDVSVATVAVECGYTSEFAFARAFKREFGIAPGRYRRSGP